LYQYECDKLAWKKHGMARSRKQTPEQIVGLLRLIEVGTALRSSIPL
jgi:hypothetical protein